MKKNKMLFGILLAFLFLLSMGITYAFFSVDVQGNELAKEIITETGTVEVLFTDGPQISLLQIRPGASTSKYFTVKNTGSLDDYYKINWQTFNNGIVNDELVVSFTCKSYSTYISRDNENNVEAGTCDNLIQEAMYNRDLKANIHIPVGYTHEYHLTVTLLETKVNQNYNQQVSFAGELQVEASEKGWARECDEDSTSLRCRIITDNTVYKDNVASTNVTDSAGISFAAISSLTNGQGVYTDNKLGDGENYYFRGSSFCEYTDYATETDGGEKCAAASGTWTNRKCSFDLSKTACEAAGFTWHELNNNVKLGDNYYKILRIDENGGVRLLYAGNSTTATGSAATIGGGDFNDSIGENASVGYMQPNSTGVTWMSNVSDYTGYWQLFTGSVSMSRTYDFIPSTGLYNLTGDIVTGSFTNAYANQNYYVCYKNEDPTTDTTDCTYLIELKGVEDYYPVNPTVVASYYTYSKTTAETNGVDSNVKTVVDAWYNTNITEFASLIDTEAGYCNDRRVNSWDGGIGATITQYNGHYRNSTLRLPSYKCAYEANDLFTVAGASHGNNALTYPVAIITADEMAYAGARGGTPNYSSFLSIGENTWTMTPFHHTGQVVRMFTHSYMSGIYGDTPNYGMYLRPIITLNSTATVDELTGGDGSLETPYIIE